MALKGVKGLVMVGLHFCIHGSPGVEDGVGYIGKGLSTDIILCFKDSVEGVRVGVHILSPGGGCTLLLNPTENGREAGVDGPGLFASSPIALLVTGLNIVLFAAKVGDKALDAANHHFYQFWSVYLRV